MADIYAHRVSSTTLISQGFGHAARRISTFQALLNSKATRWLDIVGSVQVVLDEGNSSDSDFKPNHESVLPNTILSARWFRSLSSGRLLKLLIEIFPDTYCDASSRSLMIFGFG